MNDRDRLYIEYKLREIDHRVRVVTQRFARVQQIVSRVVVSPQPICTTTIAGKIIGGAQGVASPLANSTIEVYGHSTGNNYGTFTATSGTYSIDLRLDPSDTSLDLYVTGPGSRFVRSSVHTVSVTTRCTSNTLANIQATPATGYRYITASGGCQYPVSETLTFVDSRYGSFTITWNGTFWTSGCQNETTPATACASVNTAMTFIMSGLSISIGYAALGAGGCPIAASCPYTGSQDSINATASAITSQQCPGASTSFDVTWQFTATKTHGGTATIRVHE